MLQAFEIANLKLAVTKLTEEDAKNKDIELMINYLETIDIKKVDYDHMMVNSCGHFVKSIDEAVYGDREADYEQFERVCPLCKAPSNLLMPVFTETVYQTLKENKPKPEDKDLFTIDHIALIMPNTAESLPESLQRNSTIFTKECYSKVSLDILAGENISLINFSNSVETFTSSVEQAWQDQVEMDTFKLRSKPAEIILAYIFSMSRMVGLPNAVKNYGSVGHNLYLLFRLETLKKGQPEFTDFQSFKDKSQNLCSITLPEIFASLINVLLSEDHLEFALRSMTIRCLTDKLISVGKSWLDIKYDAKHADTVMSMLKILRMAALMKYIMQYPRLLNSRINLRQRTRYSIRYYTLTCLAVSVR